MQELPQNLLTCNRFVTLNAETSPIRRYFKNKSPFLCFTAYKSKKSVYICSVIKKKCKTALQNVRSKKKEDTNYEKECK